MACTPCLQCLPRIYGMSQTIRKTRFFRSGASGPDVECSGARAHVPPVFFHRFWYPRRFIFFFIQFCWVFIHVHPFSCSPCSVIKQIGSTRARPVEFTLTIGLSNMLDACNLYQDPPYQVSFAWRQCRWYLLKDVAGGL